MREIEFRGKRIEDDKWIYGYYWYVEEHYANPIENKIHFIKSKNNGIDYGIDIETLGQYTGLKDKNGTKIFEGDVFEEERDEIRGVVVFENGAFKIKWYGIKTVLKEYGYDDGGWGEIETESFDMYYVDKMEVIGNIHDNPELLEKVGD